LQVPQRSHPLTTREPGEIIAHGSSGEIRIDQFLAQAVALSRQLPDHRYVINLSVDRYTFLLSFCAAVIANQCTLMPPNKQRQTLLALADKYRDCYSIGETNLDNVEQFDGDFDRPAADIAEAAVPEIPVHQLCAIVFTSGSTGSPTPNRKYWETLRVGSLSNVDLVMENRAGPINLLATVPPQHMWGFEMSILLPLFCNVAVSHRTPFFPQDISDALASLPEPRALVSSPVHLDAFLNADTERIRIDRIFSATSPMSARQAQQLEQRFDAGVVEIFGSSESGIIAARRTATETLWTLSGTFKLVIAADRVLVRAQHLPEDLVLHDVVELVGDDQFRWLGRHQDMVNIAGKRGSLADLNHRLNAISGVIDGVIFMPDESSPRLAALVVAPDLSPSDILEKLKPGIEPVFLPRPLYIVPMLPRQETGKLARKVVVELFEQTKRSRPLRNAGPADKST
jgi:acyl-coenzyme A synthetase/AMP-(fatty) acid ligase